MKINKTLLKRWIRSTSNQIYTFLAAIPAMYLSLPIEAQAEIYNFLLPYLPDWKVTMIAYSILGYALRLKTTKPISER